MLDQAQIDIIKATVPTIEEYGNIVTNVFYENILRGHPSLNSLFNQTNQASGHQAKALARATFAYAKNIDNLEALAAAVEHITNKHASLLIQPAQYGVVGQYLLDAFAQVLGDAFTVEIRAAWAAAYGQLAKILIEAEARLYQAKQGWTDWRDFVIAKKRPESAEITSFYLKPVAEFALPTYQPGQYVSLKVDVPALGCWQARQYSLSDKSDNEYYRITVKKEARICLDEPGSSTSSPACVGHVSDVLHDLKQEGDIVQLSAPSGEFFLDTVDGSKSPVVLISAGIGVTPLMSMLNTLVSTSSGQKISWIQGARNSQVRSFTEHITELKESKKYSLNTIIFIKDPAVIEREGIEFDRIGRVDLDRVDGKEHLFIDDLSTVYFVCGPDSFMTDTFTKLQQFGVDPSRIKSERFGVAD